MGGRFSLIVVHAAQLFPVVSGYRLAEKLAVTRGHVCELDTYTVTRIILTWLENR